MYVLAKFQLYILKAFEVTALQSNSYWKIDLYSKHRENKRQALPKTDVTYKWSEIGTRILHHHVRHELKNGLLGKLFFSTVLHHHKQSRNPWRNIDRERPLRHHMNKWP